MISEENLRLLADFNWDTAIPNLILHAHMRLRGKTVPDFFTADDFVTEAYVRIYNGERNWDPIKDPDLLKYLKSVIDSLISAAINSKDNNLSELDLTTTDQKSEEDILESLIATELHDCINETIQDDEELLILYVCITEYGKTKPQDIAEELQWDVDKVYNVKKRLKRTILKIIENRATI